MMDVLKYPDPLLRRSGKDITAFDEDLKSTVADMLETMYQHRGVGLAAPQVGLDLNLLVLNPTGTAEEADDERVLINPKIKRRKKLEYGEEGCLSFPGLYAEVERHHEIVVEYQDIAGEPHEEHLDGFLARVILHEMDHLQGVLFVDRFSPAERIRVRSKLGELEKSFAARA